jgi:hypothetical protein
MNALSAGYASAILALAQVKVYSVAGDLWLAGLQPQQDQSNAIDTCMGARSWVMCCSLHLTREKRLPLRFH